MVKNRKYYTFHDVRIAYGDKNTLPIGTITYKPLTYLNAAIEDSLLSSAISNYFPVWFGQSFGNEFNDVLVELIMRYDNQGAFWIDWLPGYEDEPSDNLKDSFGQLTTANKKRIGYFLSKMLYVYNETKDRYNQLLNYYTAQKTHLLDKIESINVMRYNDTPQNGGDWSDDEHTSNITRNESSADVLPLMDKLNSIQNNYRNLIKDWADEFKGLFIYLPED